MYCTICPQKISQHFSKNNKNWKKFILKHDYPKRYPHFDQQVSMGRVSVQKQFLNRNRVSKHGFYPFIHYVQVHEIYGKKAKVKPRKLYYSSHRDRCIYQRYAFLLNEFYNEEMKFLNLDKVSIAYRNNLKKNNIDFAKVAFDSIREYSDCWIYQGDFKEFFDSFDHNYLKERIASLLNVKNLPEDFYAIFKNVAKFRYIERSQIEKIYDMSQKGTIPKDIFEKCKEQISSQNKVGIVQGSPVSAIFSNIYMIEFDKLLNDFVTNLNGKYMRYSDDFLLIIPKICEEKRKEVGTFIKQTIDNIPGLTIQSEKTDTFYYKGNTIVDCSSKERKSLDYLGFVFDGQAVTVRAKSIAKYYYRMHKKAKTIGKSKWMTKKGNKITASELYLLYSKSEKIDNLDVRKQTYIDYIIKAKKVLELKDPEVDALISHHKRKIRKAIKKWEK